MAARRRLEEPAIVKMIKARGTGSGYYNYHSIEWLMVKVALRSKHMRTPSLYDVESTESLKSSPTEHQIFFPEIIP